MIDEAALRRAIDMAWSVHLATHRDVDVADGRRCLLERHLHSRWVAHENDIEELTCSGLDFLRRLPEEES